MGEGSAAISFVVSLVLAWVVLGMALDQCQNDMDCIYGNFDDLVFKLICRFRSDTILDNLKNLSKRSTALKYNLFRKGGLLSRAGGILKDFAKMGSDKNPEMLMEHLAELLPDRKWMLYNAIIVFAAIGTCVVIIVALGVICSSKRLLVFSFGLQLICLIVVIWLYFFVSINICPLLSSPAIAVVQFTGLSVILSTCFFWICIGFLVGALDTPEEGSFSQDLEIADV